jgi:DnaJ-class molecular chaperone
MSREYRDIARTAAACDLSTALCPRCGGHGGWIEDDGRVELEIDCPVCAGHGYATAQQLAQALKDEWRRNA